MGLKLGPKLCLRLSESKANQHFSGMFPPPPPATRRDVTGSDGLPKSKIMAPPPMTSPLQPLQQQQPYPASSSPLMTSLPGKGLQKAKPKEEHQYDSRRSETGDEQVS